MERASAAAIAAVLMLSAGAVEAQSLRGSPVAMARQNRVAQQHDYTFLQTSAQVNRFVNAGYLQRVPGNANYELAGVSHPFARPAVRLFVERLAGQYRAACGEKLVVTSLTRPVLEQPRNASDLSVHPAGMAVDLRISRKRACVRWLEKTLLSLEKQRVLDVTRERRPPHYHVALYPEPYERYVASVAGPAAVKVAAAPPKRTAPAAPAATTQVAATPPAAAAAAATQVVADASLDGDAEGIDDAAKLEAQLTEALSGPSPAEKRLVTANVAPEPAETVQTYRVNRGDSLWSIARRHGTTVDALKDLNSLTGTKIVAGQVITVPAVSAGADDS